MVTGNGRGWGKHIPGTRIEHIKEFIVGEIYLSHNKISNTKNLVKILSIDKTGLNRPLVYAAWLNLNGYLEENFVIWDFDLKYTEFYYQKNIKNQ